MSENFVKKKPRRPRKISKSYLENSGAYYLERYGSSTENFRRVMRRKIHRSADFHEQDPQEFYPLLEEVIEKFQEMKILNDDLYCFHKVRSMRRRGTSARMIHSKLSQKGLTSDQINTALSRLGDENNISQKQMEREAADKYARKRRFGPYRTPIDPERMEKDMAAMARAGYSYDIVKEILNQDEDEIFSSS